MGIEEYKFLENHIINFFNKNGIFLDRMAQNTPEDFLAFLTHSDSDEDIVSQLPHHFGFGWFCDLHINQLQDINYELQVTSYKGASQVTFSLSTCSL